MTAGSGFRRAASFNRAEAMKQFTSPSKKLSPVTCHEPGASNADQGSGNMDVKTAIQTGNATALLSLLTEEPARANQLIEWGGERKHHTHPLHYISDMLFDGTLQRGKELPLIEALLEAGADCNYQAANGETPLIGAASLDAEDVGLRLLEAGAEPDARGVFKETALHWAANVGLDRLVACLIEKGSDINLRDGRYSSTPLGWAVHGRFHSPPGSHGRHHEAAALLVAAGAKVEPEWLADEQIRADARMLSALQGERR